MQTLSAYMISVPVIIQFNIAQIPETDRSRLELFFNQILYKDRLIYVICGSKPMGMTSYSSLPIPGEENERNKIVREGWQTWCKYHHLFPSEKLIIRSIGDETRDSTITLLFLHKPHFEEMLKKHRAIFEKKLGKKVNPEEFLSIFANNPDPFQYALKQDHLLKGILFGYGLKNSQAFERSMSMDLFEGHCFGPRIFEMLAVRHELFSGQKRVYPLNLNKTCRIYKKFIEKIEKLRNEIPVRKQIKTFRKNDLKTEILKDNVDQPAFGLPVFATDPNLPETEQLRKKYSEERQEILKKCNGKNLFEVFIENL